MIAAALFDLDDTLFAQSAFLDGAWRAVADAAGDEHAGGPLLSALREIAAEGSDRGRIIDRALERIGRADLPVAPLVAAFRAYAPVALAPFPGARAGVAAVRALVPVGLVTDGDPLIQRAKLRALGMEGSFDVVVLSDELGRQHRKPDAAPFLAAAAALGVPPRCCVAVGDRPSKDIAGAANAGFLGAVRVRTGEYRDQPDVPGCLVSVAGVGDATAWLLDRLDHQKATTASAATAST